MVDEIVYGFHQHKSPSVIGHNYQGALFVGLCCHKLLAMNGLTTPPRKRELPLTIIVIGSSRDGLGNSPYIPIVE